MHYSANHEILRSFNWKLIIIYYTKLEFCRALKTLKVFSFINLKIEVGRESFPEDRERRIKRHKPKDASHTASTRKIKILALASTIHEE